VGWMTGDRVACHPIVACEVVGRFVRSISLLIRHYFLESKIRWRNGIIPLDFGLLVITSE
jgi:hypothetical protein